MATRPRLDRRKPRDLASRYVKDAEILLRNRRWSSAYYLAGYAVECALKARIAKEFRRHEIPDRALVQKFHDHTLAKLLELAGLTGILENRGRASSQFSRHWSVVAQWDSESRYGKPTKAMA